MPRQDAASARYVANFVTHLNNIKLDKSGGALTGPLDMSQQKITNVGTPTDAKDVLPKEYVDALRTLINLISVDAIGKYIYTVLPDGSKN